MENNNIENLIKLISKLPSLGQRSARRLALHMLNNKEALMKPLAAAIEDAYNLVQHCRICGNFASGEICDICQDAKRVDEVICVVENVADLWAIEKSMSFSGKYHVLHGTLSAIDNRGPEDLNIPKLAARIKGCAARDERTENMEEDEEKSREDGGNAAVSEVIIATNATIEGQTTAHYIAETLKDFNVKLSRLAHGIPIGSELDYLDDGTLGIAFKSRKEF